jgi:hypothetical protein
MADARAFRPGREIPGAQQRAPFVLDEHGFA